MISHLPLPVTLTIAIVEAVPATQVWFQFNLGRGYSLSVTLSFHRYPLRCLDYLVCVTYFIQRPIREQIQIQVSNSRIKIRMQQSMIKLVERLFISFTAFMSFLFQVRRDSVPPLVETPRHQYIRTQQNILKVQFIRPTIKHTLYVN